MTNLVSGDATKVRWFLRLYRELRRRHILESAGLYLAGGWVLIEVSATLFPIFGIPDWGMRLMLGVIVVLFPIAMMLAWTFDISLKGLVRTDAAPTRHSAIIDEADIPKRSVAVLPFTNMTGDAQKDYFGDGMAEELLNLLAKLTGLKVAARTSSFSLRNQGHDAREIGRLLGVRHVLEGSVRQAGDRIRITAQFIEAPTGYHVWSQTFDRDLTDIFAVQDEIAAAITDALRTTLEGHEELAPGVADTARSDTDQSESPEAHERTAAQLPTANMEAYQFWLRANYLWQRRGAQAITGAIGALEQAVALDPEYAEAYARLAATRAILHEYSAEPREEGFAIAESFARKALSLDPKLAEPHAVLGYMAIRLWHWRESGTHLKRALELDRSNPTVHQWYCNLLNDVGLHDDAMREALAAQHLDPIAPTANNVVALTAVFQGNDKRAAHHAAIAREYGMGGGVPDYVDFFVRLRRREFDEAIIGWRRFQVRKGLEDNWVAPVVNAIEDPDKMDDALSALHQAERQQTISNDQLFLHYLLLGQADLCFDVAATQLANHGLTHTWLMLPEAQPISRHPRFVALLASVGVIDYWQKNEWPPKFAHLKQDA